MNICLQLGWTALHHAARNGQLEICKLLITHDAKSDIESNVSVYRYFHDRHINFITCIKSFSHEAAMAKYIALWYHRYNIPYSVIIAIYK